MIYEWASSFAGLVLIEGVLFIVGDALGLLGEPVGKIKSIAHWVVDVPDKLFTHVFHHKPTRHNKAHI
jgi:hypothetical protein